MIIVNKIAEQLSPRRRRFERNEVFELTARICETNLSRIRDAHTERTISLKNLKFCWMQIQK